MLGVVVVDKCCTPEVVLGTSGAGLSKVQGTSQGPLGKLQGAGQGPRQGPGQLATGSHASQTPLRY